MTSVQRFLFVVVLCLLIQSIEVRADVLPYFSSSQQTACVYQPFLQTLTLVNTNTDLLGVTITAKDAAASTSFSKQFVIINPGMQETVELFSTFSKQGSSNVDITLTTTDGKTLTLENPITVVRCSSSSLQGADLSRRACFGVPQQFALEATNAGSFIEAYHFSLSDLNSYTTLSSNPLIVGPESKEQAYLYLNVPLTGVFDLDLSMTSELTGVTSTLPLHLEVVDCTPKQTFLNATVLPQFQTVGYHTAYPTFTVWNTGNADLDLDLSLFAPAWITMNESRLVIPIGGSETLTFITQPPLNQSPGNYTLKMDMYDGQVLVASPTIMLELKSSVASPSWLKYSPLVLLLLLLIIVGIVVMRRRKKDTPEESPEVTAEQIESVVAESTEEPTAAKIYKQRDFGESDSQGDNNSRGLKVLVGLLLIFLAIFLFLYLSGFSPFTPQQNTTVSRTTNQTLQPIDENAKAVDQMLSFLNRTHQTSNFRYQVWEANYQKKLNLSLYFSDPDHDNLTYAMTQKPEHLQVNVQGSVVTFTPDRYWYGVDSVRFTANDGQYAANSTQMTLIVTPLLKRTWKDWVIDHVVLLLVALVILLFLIAMKRGYQQVE
ncbi:hypothetical protein HZB02_03845 [Candidatus Woesearchaeota archaeon]|nr:hypothetical protein [Candidatus Woesearchaeota archaeon]